jgi:hypothetical protein
VNDTLPDKLPHPDRPRLVFGKTSGFFGRRIRCRRPLPAAGSDPLRLVALRAI